MATVIAVSDERKPMKAVLKDGVFCEGASWADWDIGRSLRTFSTVRILLIRYGQDGGDDVCWDTRTVRTAHLRSTGSAARDGANDPALVFEPELLADTLTFTRGLARDSAWNHRASRRRNPRGRLPPFGLEPRGNRGRQQRPR
jgi:hypothetical protein